MYSLFSACSKLLKLLACIKIGHAKLIFHFAYMDSENMGWLVRFFFLNLLPWLIFYFAWQGINNMVSSHIFLLFYLTITLYQVTLDDSIGQNNWRNWI